MPGFGSPPFAPPLSGESGGFDATIIATAVVGLSVIPAASISAGTGASISPTAVLGVSTIPSASILAGTGAMISPTAIVGTSNIFENVAGVPATIFATAIAALAGILEPSIAVYQSGNEPPLGSDYSIWLNEQSKEITIDEGGYDIERAELDPNSIYVNTFTTQSEDQLQMFGYFDEVVTKVGTGRFYLPVRATIVGVSATVSSAPVGSDMVIDVNIDGQSVFAPGSEPSILDGQTSMTEVPVVTAVEAGSTITVDIDQVGSTTPGNDLMVTVRYRTN